MAEDCGSLLPCSVRHASAVKTHHVRNIIEQGRRLLEKGGGRVATEHKTTTNTNKNRAVEGGGAKLLSRKTDTSKNKFRFLGCTKFASIVQFVF